MNKNEHGKLWIQAGGEYGIYCGISNHLFYVYYFWFLIFNNFKNIPEKNKLINIEEKI